MKDNGLIRYSSVSTNSFLKQMHGKAVMIRLTVGLFVDAGFSLHNLSQVIDIFDVIII